MNHRSARSQRATLYYEAKDIGRALADLRLWREGSALVPARAAVSRIEPQRGRALTRLHAGRPELRA